MNVVLISTYDLGHQPFGLSSPAAWLRERGHSVCCLDLSREPLAESALRDADLVAFYVPMHTATRLAAALVEPVRRIRPSARLCFYGLYAPVNEQWLRRLGIETILGGEFEAGLVALADRLAASPENPTLMKSAAVGGYAGIEARAASPPAPAAATARVPENKLLPGASASSPQPEPVISLARQRFLVPDRSGLVPLSCYAQIQLPDGSRRVAGYTEASRGCKHRCRHCPIVPVYEGVFRVVQPEVVLEDIRRQVRAGAEHITFGDPDFFNGPRHALQIVRALHAEFPALSYDVTIKVEHLLARRADLAVLRDTGCLFVTTAVESLDDAVLARLDKGHTRADFCELVRLARDVGLVLHPTFIPFTPWTTPEGYADFLDRLASLDLVENVAPVQLAIRMLVPAGSRLLELEEVRRILSPFDPSALVYPWRHPDRRVDSMQREVEAIVMECQSRQASRPETFSLVHRAAHQALGNSLALPRVERPRVARAAIPYLTEPWYC
jgi:radical SAM superfamily enzyme YgiQ (UPF0313 family)